MDCDETVDRQFGGHQISEESRGSPFRNQPGPGVTRLQASASYRTESGSDRIQSLDLQATISPAERDCGNRLSAGSGRYRPQFCNYSTTLPNGSIRKPHSTKRLEAQHFDIRLLTCFGTFPFDLSTSRVRLSNDSCATFRVSTSALILLATLFPIWHSAGRFSVQEIRLSTHKGRDDDHKKSDQR